MAATLMEKLGVDIPPQVILGACRPQLAHRASRRIPQVATVLPCNVVVRQTGTDACIVEAFDPDEMTRLSDNEALKSVATTPVLG